MSSLSVKMGHMAIFIACLYLLLYTTPNTAAAARIGAIVNTRGRVGKEQRTAIEIAVEDFNSPATPLFLNVKNSSLPAATAVEDLAGAWEADAILVGTGTWTDESIIAAVKKETQFPLTVSFPRTVESAHAPSRPWLLPMRGNTFTDRIQCVADLVGSYSWRRVVVVYEEDAAGTLTTESFSVISDALRAVGSDIQRTVPFERHGSSSKNPKETIREGLARLKADICRVFVVVQASKEFRSDLFQEATELDMMTEGYVWVAVDGDMAARDTSPSMTSPLANEQGVVEVRNYVNASDPSYKDFLVKFRRRFRSNYGHGERNLDPGQDALLAYDAVHAVAAMASTRTVKVDVRPAAVNFRGLSGHIQLLEGDEEGRPNQLLTSGTKFTIMNTVGNGQRVMGFWSEGDGFHKEDVAAATKTTSSSEKPSATQVFGSVYWPGGPSWVPGGWDVLHVIVPARSAFDEFVKVELNSDGKLERVTGFSIDVFEEALKQMPYELRVKYHPYNGTYDCMVDMVHYSKRADLSPYAGTDEACRKDIDQSTRRYDAAVGDIAILSSRSKKVDFTVPYLESGLAKIVQVRHDEESFIFLKPFTWRLWLTIVLVTLYTGGAVWFLEQDANSEERVNQSWRQIGDGLWFTYLTFYFAQGRLHSNFAKVAIVMWLFTALVLAQSYTASLSSILTVQKLQPVERRGSGRVGCDGDSFVLNYLHNVLGYRDIQKIGSQGNYPEAFQNGNITTAYLELPHLRIFLSKHGDDFMVNGKANKLAGLGLAFDKGSPLTADMSTAILSIIDNGTLKYLTEKTFTDDLFGSTWGDPSENKENLDINSFWLLFVLSGGASTVVLIFSRFRVLLRKYRRRRFVGRPNNISPDDVGMGGSSGPGRAGSEDLEVGRGGGVGTRSRAEPAPSPER